MTSAYVRTIESTGNADVVRLPPDQVWTTENEKICNIGARRVDNPIGGAMGRATRRSVRIAVSRPVAGEPGDDPLHSPS